jgi:hypothetical protein
LDLALGIWYLVLRSQQLTRRSDDCADSVEFSAKNQYQQDPGQARGRLARRGRRNKAHQSKAVENFKALWSEKFHWLPSNSTRENLWNKGRGRLARRGRCNRALPSNLVRDFKAVWSEAREIKDPVIKGVKPGLGCGEMLRGVQAD